VEQDKLEKLLTAYVDEEISDPSQLNEIKNLIDKDQNVKYDYEVHHLMKLVVKQRLKIHPVSSKVLKRIIRKIKPVSKTEYFKGFIQGIFSAKPLMVFGTTIIIILAMILIIFNRPPQIIVEDFSAEQKGSDNMFVQARINFQNILKGNLIPQIVSDNPEEIKSFFLKEGVKYQIILPEYDKWKLLGAIVSVNRGEKFAHHVYTDNEGKLIYFFQADENYFEKNKILNLSEGLLEYLEKENCYDTYESGIGTLMTKTGKNIIAVVSNISSYELKDQFCKIN